MEGFNYILLECSIAIDTLTKMYYSSYPHNNKILMPHIDKNVLFLISSQQQDPHAMFHVLCPADLFWNTLPAAVLNY